jgi:hypothetical protein
VASLAGNHPRLHPQGAPERHRRAAKRSLGQPPKRESGLLGLLVFARVELPGELLRESLEIGEGVGACKSNQQEHLHRSRQGSATRSPTTEHGLAPFARDNLGRHNRRPG